MDAKVQWKISDDVESLIAAVMECKHQLVKGADAKYGRSTKQVSCDVYAGTKILELFQLSTTWMPCLEFTEEDLKVPVHRRQKKSMVLVADFGLFKLHRMDVLGTSDIRVVTVFEEPNSSAEQTMFGNVELT